MKRFLESLERFGLDRWRGDFEGLIREKERHIREIHGRGRDFEAILKRLPEVEAGVTDLAADAIGIGLESDLKDGERESLHRVLQELSPWRKGPFNVFGIGLDAEWASNIKWNRVKRHIKPLTGRRVMDIGSSSGYYMFKMAGYVPEFVLGLEPYLAFYFQFKALWRYVGDESIFCIPARLEEMPVLSGQFHTIFCMGILYHCKSPLDILKLIHKNLKRGGELVAETLILDCDESVALFPEKRYAGMKNVFFIPSPACLENWLGRAGFKNIRCVDVSKTTLEEQRKTDWINTESLEDFLDPDNHDRTIEGLPAPVRAVFIADR